MTVSHFYIKHKNTKLTFSALERFSLLKPINTYEVATPQWHLGEKKSKRAVLLLHGFASSPREFQDVTAALKAQGIPYYAPQITGFCIGDFHLLKAARLSDWLRSAVEGFDFLSRIAEKVDVVGSSNGGCLAWLLSAHRSIDRLLLLAPYIAPMGKGAVYKNIVMAPLLGDLFCFFRPVALLPQQVRGSPHAFRYQSVPLEALVLLWRLQNKLQRVPLRAESTYVFYGVHDKTVNLVEMERMLKQRVADLHIFRYENTAHQLLRDADRQAAVADIIRVLQERQLPQERS